MTIYSFIPLACAECNDSLPFSGASSIPLFYVLFPATLLHQLFFHPLSSHLANYFLVYLSILLFPNSYITPFWEFYFLPFYVHAQTNVIYVFLRFVDLHPGMILVNNQPDAQFFMYVYFYSLHISGSHVSIIRRIIVSMQHLVYVTLCRCRLTYIPDSHLHAWYAG